MGTVRIAVGAFTVRKIRPLFVTVFAGSLRCPLALVDLPVCSITRYSSGITRMEIFPPLYVGKPTKKDAARRSVCCGLCKRHSRGLLARRWRTVSLPLAGQVFQGAVNHGAPGNEYKRIRLWRQHWVVCVVGSYVNVRLLQGCAYPNLRTGLSSLWSSDIRRLALSCIERLSHVGPALRSVNGISRSWKERIPFLFRLAWLRLRS